jgi:hypothetical protein
MDALDPLVDFASLITWSTTAATPIAPDSDDDNIAQMQKIPDMLHQYPSAAPAPIQHLHDSVKTKGQMHHQHSTPTPAMLQGALLAHLVQAQEHTLKERDLMVDYRPRWLDCTLLEQCPDQQIPTHLDTSREPHNHYVTSWMDPYMLANTMPIAREPWAPQQYPRSFYVAEEIRQLMILGAEFYEVPCMNGRCHCEVERNLHSGTARRPDFLDQLRGENKSSVAIETRGELIRGWR